MTSNKFHKVSNKGMDQFIDPVGDEQTPTTIFSSHQGTDMIENLSLQACMTCDNMACTCDPVDEQTTTIFSQHQGNEMKMNKAIIKSKLETVSDDPSELVAKFICRMDGMTTVVPLADFSNTEKVSCASCGSKNLTRLHQRDYENVAEFDRMEDIESRKPQFKNHFIKGCVKCNGFVDVRHDLNAKKCHCENPQIKTIETWLRDVSGTAGSVDPMTVMGFTPASAIMQALGIGADKKNNATVYDYATGERIPVLDKMIKDIHTRRIMEDDVFAKEVPKRRINAECDIPIELQDQDRDIPKLDKLTSAGAMTRKVVVLLSIPETAEESIAIALRKATRDNIIENMNKKIARISKGNDFDGSQSITQLQINTAYKYVGMKPLETQINFEPLRKAMTTLFWSAIPSTKDAIKAVATKDITTVLVPEKSKFREFQNAMKVIVASATEVDMKQFNPRGWNDVEITTIKSDGTRTSRIQRFYDISIRTKEELDIATKNKQVRDMAKAKVNSSPHQIEMPIFVNGISKVMKSSIRNDDSARIEYIARHYVEGYEEITKAKVDVPIQETQQVALVQSVKPKYVAKNIDFWDYEPTAKTSPIGTPYVSPMFEAWKNTMPITKTSNEQLLHNYLRQRLNPATSISGEKAHAIIGAVSRFNVQKSNDSSIGVDEESTPSPLSNKQINILPSHQEPDMNKKLLTFEEAHGKYPSDDDIYKMDEDGIAWRDQFNLCCCECERCSPACKCGEIYKVKLAIVGTSKAEPSAYQAVYDRVKSEMDKVGKDNLEIVSGGATGIDSIAKQVANDLGLPIKEFLPKEQTTEYFLKRNKEIAEYSTHVVAFVNKLTKTKCYHHGAESANHERTGGCYVGRQLREQGKDNYETIVLN